MIDPKVFAAFMAVIGDRLGRQLEQPTLRLYYAELSAALDTAAFDRGARVIFDRDLFGQWPSVEAIVEAAGITRTAYAVPDAAHTLAAIDAQRALPAASRDAVDDFGVNWRRQLAHCAPAALEAERLARAAQATPNGIAWASDPTPLQEVMRAELANRDVGRPAAAERRERAA